MEVGEHIENSSALAGVRICFTGLSAARESELVEGLRRAGATFTGPLTRGASLIVP